MVLSDENAGIDEIGESGADAVGLPFNRTLHLLPRLMSCSTYGADAAMIAPSGRKTNHAAGQLQRQIRASIFADQQQAR